jgi:hypothetical protein
VVDGAENNVPSWVQTRHIEIAKVFSEDEHASIPDFLVISSKTWDKLTPDQQQILIKAAKASEVYQQNSCGGRSTPIPARRPKPWGAKLSKWIKRRSAPPCSRYLMTSKRSEQAALLAKFEAAAE